MKLRFHKNTLRLRLSQSEVARLSETGAVSDRVEFPNQRALSFSLESGPSEAARFDPDSIRIQISQPQAAQWISTDQTGIEFTAGPLQVVIEKDFQCLHKPTPEDADAFPNPLVDKF